MTFLEFFFVLFYFAVNSKSPKTYGIENLVSYVRRHYVFSDGIFSSELPLVILGTSTTN